jgi:hypothetical protein
MARRPAGPLTTSGLVLLRTSRGIRSFVALAPRPAGSLATGCRALPRTFRGSGALVAWPPRFSESLIAGDRTPLRTLRVDGSFDRRPSFIALSPLEPLLAPVDIPGALGVLEFLTWVAMVAAWPPAAAT